MEKKSSDFMLEEVLIKENIEILSKSFQKVLNDTTPAGKYFIHTRKISPQTVAELEIYSLQGKFELKSLGKDGLVRTIKSTLNCAATPIYDHMHNLVGICLIHLDTEGKKDEKIKGYAKQNIALSGIRVARLQPDNNSSVVCLGEGIETVASVVDIIRPQQDLSKFCFLASLGIDSFPLALAYIKTNFPPNTVVVLLKDHDELDSDADIKFWKHYSEFVDSGFKIVVRQPELKSQVKGYDWNDVLREHVGTASELYNQFFGVVSAPQYSAYKITTLDSELGSMKILTVEQTLFESFVKVRQALNEHYLSQKKDQLLSFLKKQIPLLETALASDKAKSNLIRIEKEIKKIKYMLMTEYGLNFDRNSNLNNDNAQKYELLSLEIKSSEEEINKLDKIETWILENSSKQLNGMRQFDEFLEKYYDFSGQNKLEIIEREIRDRVILARKRRILFPFEEKVEDPEEQFEIQMMSIFDGLNSAIDKKDDREKQRLLAIAVDKSIKLPVSILEKLDIKELEELPVVLLEELPVEILLKEISSESFLLGNLNLNTEEKKEYTLNEKIKRLSKEKIISCCEYQKYVLDIDISRRKTIRSKLDDTYKEHKLLELKSTVEELNKKIDEKVEERTLQHQTIDESENALGKQYLTAIRRVAGDKKLLQLWIQGAFSDMAVASPILYSEFKNATPAKIDDRDSDELTTVYALRDMLLKVALIPEEQVKQNHVFFYALEFAGQLYKSFEFKIREGFHQEFDGIVIRNGIPVVMERKANDGTGEDQLLVNFINGKLVTKMNFYIRLLAVNSEEQKEISELLASSEFIIKDIDKINHYTIPSDLTEKLMAAAKLLAIDALGKKLFEFTLNQPKNLASDFEIQAPQDMSVTVRFSIRGKGNEDVSSEFVMKAIKRIIESRNTTGNILQQPETPVQQNETEIKVAASELVHDTYAVVTQKLSASSHAVSEVVQQNDVIAEQPQNNLQLTQHTHLEVKQVTQFFATTKKTQTTIPVIEKDSKENDQMGVEQKGGDSGIPQISLNNTKR